MPQSKRTALIVDDSPEDRELYRRYLLRDTECSYTLLEASTGQQGLDLWRQHQPEVVLLDYRLPDLDGLEFLAQLSVPTLQPCFPVILLTGQGSESIAVQAIKAGAQDYLVKEQITPEGLQLAVNGAIEAVRLRTQLQQRIDRERVVAQITKQIRRSLELERVLQTTVTEVRDFLHTDRVLVFKLKPDGNGTVVAESVGTAWRSLLDSTIYDPCLAANYLRFSRPESITHDLEFAEDYVKRYRQGQVTAIDNIQNSSIDPCHIELLASFQVQANLVVPILHDDQFWGLLIAHHCTAPRAWQPLEIDLLKELATQVSIALRQAELYQQSQQELAERRRVEQSLRESEVRYATLAQISPVGIFRTDASGDCQYANARWCELAGLTVEDAQGDGWVRAVHPDDRDRVAAEWYRAATLNLPFVSEYRFQTPEGVVSWLVGQAVAEKDSQDNVIGYVGTVTDITDRKHIEQALQASEEHLRLALQASRMGTWDWNIQTGQIIWSENLEALFGLAPGEFDGSYEMFSSRLHPNDREHVLAAVQHAIATGEDYDLEFRALYPNGTIRWAMTQGKVFYDPNGQPVRMAGIDLDITERKQAEESLRQSEEFKRRMLDSSSDCIKLLDTDGRLLYMNTGGLCLLEIDEFSSFINKDWMSFWQEDDRATVEDAIATAKAGDVGRFQGFCATAKGAPKWWDVLVTAIFNTDGQVGQLLATSRDITDRRQAERLLQESEARLKLAHQATRSGLWDWDVARNVAHVSEEYCALLGFDPAMQEVSFEQWLSRVYPDDRDPTSAAVQQTLQQKQEYYTADYRVLHPDGIRWIAARAQAFFDPAGKAVRLLGNVQDITDRKQAVESLRQSEERYRTLFESMEDGFCIIELLFDEANTPIDYRFLETNPAFEQQTGLREAVGQSARQLIPDLEHDWFEVYGRVALTGEPIRFENSSDAMNRWFDVYAFRVGEPESHKVAILFKEISERKLAEAEREILLVQEQAARAEAERANRIKDEFLAVLSHELRSPLNPILGWTKLLQTRSFDATVTAQALRTIERNARLQTQLIDDLLDMAKILGGKLSVSSTPVNLAFVVEAAIDTVRTAAVAKTIQLHLSLPNLGQVSGDATRLQQIVWNLLSNAIKFTPEGGRVDLRLERVDHHAHIIVSDTGKGINPDFLPHIFESFRQEDVSVTRKYGGLGLGLAIVRQLVEAHGGTITADSPGEGLGATFIVRLPLLSLAPEGRQTAPSEPALDLTGIRILTVDDDPDARELLNVLLTQYGAEVLTVGSATEVMAKLQAFAPDVLVSDIGMPAVDGYTLIQQIRTLAPENGGQIPAIALTAYAREDDQQRAIASGYQKHVTKPLEPERLVQAVMSIAQSQRNQSA